MNPILKSWLDDQEQNMIDELIESEYKILRADFEKQTEVLNAIRQELGKKPYTYETYEEDYEFNSGDEEE